MCLILSVLISIIIIISSDGYLNLIVSRNKILYAIINGTASIKELFWDRMVNFIFPMIIIVILGLNYFLCYLSFLLVGYQFVIFCMTIYAVIDMYGFFGVLGTIILMLPVNLIFFASLIFLSVVCLERSKQANKYKYFLEGYSDSYFLKIIVCIAIGVGLTILVSIVFPLILKSAIFSIY